MPTIEEIIQALKQAYGSKYGVADDIYRGMAEALAATGLVTKENLATVVQGQEKVLRAAQSANDKVATELANLKREKAELEAKVNKQDPPKPDPKQDPPKPDPNKPLTLDDVTAAISKALEPVTTQIKGITDAAKAKTRSEEVAAKAKEYGIPENFVKRFAIPDDANLDDYFKEVKQDFANSGFEGTKPPEQGSGSPSETDAKQVASLIDAGTKEIIKNQSNK